MMRLLAIIFVVVFIGHAHAEGEAKPAASSSKDGKFAQIHINPISAAFGLIDVGADFALGDHLTLGPAIMSLSYKADYLFYDLTYKALGYGARAAWQFNGKAIGSGWILSALYIYFPKYTITGKQQIISFTNSEYTSETTESLAALTFGYRWLWWGHMSLKVALGPRYNSLAKTIVMKDPNGNTLTVDTNKNQTGLGLGGEATLGFAF
jgi:hypothetical protein